jgi:hypothetical protein
MKLCQAVIHVSWLKITETILSAVLAFALLD